MQSRVWRVHRVVARSTDRSDIAVSAIPHVECLTARAAQYQALQGRQVFALGPFKIGAPAFVRFFAKRSMLRVELLPGNLAVVMGGKVHPPLRHRQSLRVLADFALSRNLPAVLISPIRARASKIRVLEQNRHPAMSKSTPYQRVLQRCPKRRPASTSGTAGCASRSALPPRRHFRSRYKLKRPARSPRSPQHRDP